MREEDLKRFFLGELDAERLAAEAACSISRIDEIETSIAIEDMDRDFTVTRDHMRQLLTAALAGKLNEAELNAIAFTLIASDRFEFNEDEVVIEVLHDWSAPEINYPINNVTLEMHRSWLDGINALPARQPLSKSKGIVVSRRWKRSI
ncbi:hypothetical protein [Occallatibacter savannae]|uniref:hypothetical protein n=1 Tax=Occallatibacter savannae TaxID=1002691 RepID=UPI000D688DA0|nr:hypothetical protein [Occallatibacter savannae]